MTTAARPQTGAGAPRPSRTASGLGSSLRLFTIAGIDVAVHVSWLAIAALVTWSLATGYFPYAIPEASDAQDWVLGIVAALLFFGSVLLHELAHSLVARALDLDVSSITLFIFGGVSNLTGEPKEPATEFRMAVVGPLTSFAIAAVSFVVASLVDDAAVAAVASYLAIINAILGAFNLVPGFPLDGGRVLRSILWGATHDLRRATRIASSVGQLVAWGLMLIGLWQVFDGNLFGGIWTIAIGWFLQSAAVMSGEQSDLEARMRRLRVSDAVRPDPTSVAPSISVTELIEQHLLPGGRSTLPVAAGEQLVGLVRLDHVARVPAERRSTTSVAQIMEPLDGLVVVSTATGLADATAALERADQEQAVVVDGGRLVGLLSRGDIVRELRVREALKLPT